MNQSKISDLLEHVKEGGSLDAAVIAPICGVTSRSTKTIQNYLDAVMEAAEEVIELTIGGPNPYVSDEEDGEVEDEDESEDEDEDESEDEDEEEEEEEETPPPAPAPKKPKPPAPATTERKKEYKFFIENEDGTSSPIERLESKTNGNVITFRRKTPQDIVTLIVKGKTVEVDIVPLRKMRPSEMSEFGISNELLLNLALAAK